MGTEKIGPKYSFRTFLMLFETGGGVLVCLVSRCVEGCVPMCQGQTGNIPCLSPGRMTIFHI